MITELMIILTVVGAGIVLVVWIGSRRRRSDGDNQDIEDSTAKFKKDLENTANEIIGRMETQATHIESLLDDTERNRTQMEGRIAEMKKLIKRSENQSSEVRDLLTRLDDAVEDVDAMKRQIEQVERKISAVSNAKTTVMNSTQQKIAAYQQPRPATAPAQPKPAAFAKVLEKSIAEPAKSSNQTTTRSAAILPREPAKPAAPANPEAARIEAIRQNLIKNAARISAQTNANASPKPAPNVRPPNNRNEGVNRQASALIPAAKNITPQVPPNKIGKTEVVADSRSIRDMLLSGMGVEEVARETGLGRGAIELVQQMIRHQLEKR